ncbi:class I adenylate-forming enzyme family protein [Gemmobacter sp.]|uniref:class I adenylate-forming enzyme family protein n=1 Tax=Gemmobacter sp. TaxID=1898957 RepID=UPI002AFF353D|nr:AMP-binding protein [Gemmobacter sp.]
MSWQPEQFPPMRAESHYGTRVVQCFTDRPRNLYLLLADSLARDPGAEALVGAGRRLTWAALAAEVDRVAGALAEQGVAMGDRVVMVMGNRPDFVITLFALFRLGAVAVPVSTRSAVAEVAFVITNTTARLVVHDAALAGLVPDGAVALAFAGLEGAAPLPALADLPAEDEVAMILHTSGTTGKPKGAMLTHLAQIHAAMFYQVALGLTAQDRVVASVPLNHLTGISALICAPMRAGAALVIMENFRAKDFLDLAEAERMTFTLMVPAMYNLCLLQPDFAARDLGRWRLAAYGGAPMPEPTIRRLADAVPGLAFANCYGATESVVAQLITPPEFAFEKREYVGCALPGTDVRIMDDQGHEVPAGVEGEIWLAGPNVVPGYWNNPEATAKGFVGGYWRSGDVGVADADGFVRVLDRAKDMINRGGFKIYSAELENVLTDHPAVIEAAAVARPCPVLGERVHARVTVREGVAPEVLRDWCRDRLSDYKVPETLDISADPLPRNANGKVDKKLIRDGLAPRG